MPPKIRVRKAQSHSITNEELTRIEEDPTSDLGIEPLTPKLPEGALLDESVGDSTQAETNSMEPEVAESIKVGIRSLESNYGSVKDLLVSQEKLVQRILERQNELEKAFNTRIRDIASMMRNASSNGQMEDDCLAYEELADEPADGEVAAKPASADLGTRDSSDTDANVPAASGEIGDKWKKAAIEATSAIKVCKEFADIDLRPHEPHTWLHKVVESKWFEWVSAVVIFTHSLFISYYVEYLATVSSDGHAALTIINLVLTSFFIVEVGLKLWTERMEYFLGCERRWNIFDMVLIFLVVLQLALMLILAGKDKKKMKTVLKIAEMARTARILRIFRFLKFSTTLQIIIFKIFRSIGTLSWVMLLMFMMIFVVAVSFTQGANDFLGGRQLDPTAILTEHELGLKNNFGSVGTSIRTCFASVSGGIAWSQVYTELEEVSVLYSSIFALYIFAATFAMFNIITGIFMNDMQRADADFERELLSKEMHRQHIHLASMFEDLDASGDGAISLEEFLEMADHPVIQDYLAAVGIAPDDAQMLFFLLDEDASGELTISEFLSGSHSLTKTSTGMDMKVMLYENRHMRGVLTACMSHLDGSLQQVGKAIDGVKSRLATINPGSAKSRKKAAQVDPPTVVCKSLAEILPERPISGSVLCPTVVGKASLTLPDRVSRRTKKARKTLEQRALI